jgi:hypothetical protein
MEKMNIINRLLVVAGISLVLWAILFLAVYGAVRLAERFGVC